jgi:hypothetical protein
MFGGHPHPAKTPSPNANAADSPIDADTSCDMFAKAAAPMVMTESGIWMDEMLVPENARGPIDVTEFGIVTVVKVGHPSKASAIMVTASDANVK